MVVKSPKKEITDSFPDEVDDCIDLTLELQSPTLAEGPLGNNFDEEYSSRRMSNLPEKDIDALAKFISDMSTIHGDLVAPCDGRDVYVQARKYMKYWFPSTLRNVGPGLKVPEYSPRGIPKSVQKDINLYCDRILLKASHANSGQVDICNGHSSCLSVLSRVWGESSKEPRFYGNDYSMSQTFDGMLKLLSSLQSLRVEMNISHPDQPLTTYHTSGPTPSCRNYISMREAKKYVLSQVNIVILCRWVLKTIPTFEALTDIITSTGRKDKTKYLQLVKLLDRFEESVVTGLNLLAGETYVHASKAKSSRVVRSSRNPYVWSVDEAKGALEDLKSYDREKGGVYILTRDVNLRCAYTPGEADRVAIEGASARKRKALSQIGKFGKFTEVVFTRTIPCVSFNDRDGRSIDFGTISVAFPITHILKHTLSSWCKFPAYAVPLGDNRWTINGLMFHPHCSNEPLYNLTTYEDGCYPDGEQELVAHEVCLGNNSLVCWSSYASKSVVGVMDAIVDVVKTYNHDNCYEPLSYFLYDYEEDYNFDFDRDDEDDEDDDYYSDEDECDVDY